jgi:hypothetical protein
MRAAVTAALCAGALAALPASIACANHRAVDAPPLEPAVAALAPGLKPQGAGEMRHFGFAICDGWYWAPDHRYSPEQPFVLDLRYVRNLSGAGIAKRSGEEIEKLGIGTVAERAAWIAAMERIFPDVAKGDHLTGLNLPPGSVRYFHNGKAVGAIDDPAFARAFFAIWFDPRTSRPDFRRELLGAP